LGTGKVDLTGKHNDEFGVVTYKIPIVNFNEEPLIVIHDGAAGSA
jgi:hypothetical protein